MASADIYCHVYKFCETINVICREFSAHLDSDLQHIMCVSRADTANRNKTSHLGGGGNINQFATKEMFHMEYHVRFPMLKLCPVILQQLDLTSSPEVNVTFGIK